MKMNKEKLNCISKFIKEIKIDISVEELLPAFIHRSYLNETHAKGLGNNERLEFLGDAVLELISTEFLFDKYKDRSEGELTALRSALVRGRNLSGVAENLKIFDCIFLSKGESKTTGKARGLILANTIEAIIGAIYLNKGIDDARKFINQFVLCLIEGIVSDKLYVDSKSDFQEKVQERDKVTPHYKVMNEKGPDHDKLFESGVYIGERLIAVGKGSSKNQAEQNAAEIALKKEFSE